MPYYRLNCQQEIIFSGKLCVDTKSNIIYTFTFTFVYSNVGCFILHLRNRCLETHSTRTVSQGKRAHFNLQSSKISMRLVVRWIFPQSKHNSRLSSESFFSGCRKIFAPTNRMVHLTLFRWSVSIFIIDSIPLLHPSIHPSRVLCCSSVGRSVSLSSFAHH